MKSLIASIAIFSVGFAAHSMEPRRDFSQSYTMGVFICDTKGSVATYTQQLTKNEDGEPQKLTKISKSIPVRQMLFKIKATSAEVAVSTVQGSILAQLMASNSAPGFDLRNLEINCVQDYKLTPPEVEVKE